MAGRQENATGGIALADEVARCRGRQDAILADQELLDTVGSTDLGDQLDDLGVPEPAITADNEERV